MNIIQVDLTHAQLESYFKELDARGIVYRLNVADIGSDLALELVLDGLTDPGVCIALRPDGAWSATAQLKAAS